MSYPRSIDVFYVCIYVIIVIDLSVCGSEIKQKLETKTKNKEWPISAVHIIK